MRRFHPFVVGSVLAGLAVGGVAGSEVLNRWAVVTFGATSGACAALAALVCWRWPGLSAPAWKLWPMATITNPLFLIGVYWSIDEYECLLRLKRGWDCMLTDLAPALAGIALVPPTAGLLLRFLSPLCAARRSRTRS
ncbi:MAG: hypothetical protein U1E60_26070 [Reyranellaceae bacterium]